MDQKRYAVVKFDEDNSLAVIPITWFVGDTAKFNECVWPPRSTSSTRINKYVFNEEPPRLDEWETFGVTTVAKAVKYGKARKLLIQYEYTSQLDTGSDEDEDRIVPRKKRKPRRYVNDDHDSDASERDPDSPPPSPSPPPPPPPPRIMNGVGAGSRVTSQQPSASRDTSQQPSASGCTSQQPSASGGTSQQLSASRGTPQQPSASSTSRGTSQQPSASRGTSQQTSTSRGTSQQPSTSRSTLQPPSALSMQQQRISSNQKPLLEHMLNLLEDIRETQRIHSHQLNTLQRKGNANEQSCRWEIPEGVSFPLRTIEDATLMNTKLQDSGFKNGLISYLADFGGRNTWEATKRVLSFMISNDLAQLCNMTGANGKLAFGATPLFDCVFRGIKQNNAATTRADVEKEVSKWLQGSRDRGGGRARRQRQRNNNAVEQ